MQGLILAAGMGRRLGKKTEDNTKCMIEVGGKRLVAHALDSFVELVEKGETISRVVLVIGYKGDNVIKEIGDDYKGIKIEYVDNPIYDKTNNIYSLWLARDYLKKDDTILLESDLIFDKKIISDIVKDPEPDLVVVDRFEPYMDGTVTLVDEENNITNFIPGKSFEWKSAGDYYKTVNIYKFSKDFSVQFYLPFLRAYSESYGHNEYYEQVLRALVYLKGTNLKAHKLTGEKWYEIDDMQDLDIATAIFSNGSDKLVKYQKRFGGYWRFPEMLDFCYLVNPYFPTERLKDELKYNFDHLIAEYPSGLNVQNLLAGSMLGCEENQILVGNGAAELINGMINTLTGKIGVIYPTFNEYPERVGEDRLVKFVIKNEDFSYTVDELIEFSAQIENLILINPDNPSGHFIKKDDIIRLLEHFEKSNKRLILDESFVDFAEEDEWFSMIDTDILNKYKSLIVIKSISKSYGVPGIRLGVLATGDSTLRDSVRERISIWNINSFGECFLQVISKHIKDYWKACRYIRDDRAKLFADLETLPFFKVMKSVANYFLCEIISKYDSTELTRFLLEKHNLFIKDLRGKFGFNEDKNYIRIAVRNQKDNDRLIEVLRNME